VWTVSSYKWCFTAGHIYQGTAVYLETLIAVFFTSADVSWPPYSMGKNKILLEREREIEREM
jgi:hypothetical protein